MKTISSKRVDAHRPGAIVPRDYEPILSYLTPGSEPFDSFHMPEVRALCESIGWGRAGGATRMFGHVGKCGVCGARFRAGDVWRHMPTGDLVHLGHDCASKYELVADRSDFDAAWESIQRRKAVLKEATRRERQYAMFCDHHLGLQRALDLEHPIARDLKEKLRQYGKLSEKQVALALRLEGEASRPKPEPEKHVPAPLGRLVVRGRVVSKKTHEGPWGDSLKVVVKIETPEGSWLCWGTWSYSSDRVDVGDVVEFRGTLEAGREPHFAFFKRPSNAKIVVKKNPESEVKSSFL